MNFRNQKELIYPDLSFKIINCVYDVHNRLGGGLKEIAYQKALEVKFSAENIPYEAQLQLQTKFNSMLVSRDVPDFIVYGKILIEIKSRPRFTLPDFTQTLRYLKLTELQLGLLINFGTEKVTVRRVVNLRPHHPHP